MHEGYVRRELRRDCGWTGQVVRNEDETVSLVPPHRPHDGPSLLAALPIGSHLVPVSCIPGVFGRGLEVLVETATTRRPDVVTDTWSDGTDGVLVDLDNPHTFDRALWALQREAFPEASGRPGLAWLANTHTLMLPGVEAVSWSPSDVSALATAASQMEAVVAVCRGPRPPRRPNASQHATLAVRREYLTLEAFGTPAPDDPNDPIAAPAAFGRGPR
jgi:hypothetical protein